jgi:hypothetical protein
LPVQSLSVEQAVHVPLLHTGVVPEQLAFVVHGGGPAPCHSQSSALLL